MANLTHTGYIGIDIRAFGATPGTSRKGVSVHINIGTWLFGKGTGAVSEVADGVAVGGVQQKEIARHFSINTVLLLLLLSIIKK
jgi:hypothetical protein